MLQMNHLLELQSMLRQAKEHGGRHRYADYITALEMAIAELEKIMAKL